MFANMVYINKDFKYISMIAIKSITLLAGLLLKSNLCLDYTVRVLLFSMAELPYMLPTGDIKIMLSSY